MIECKTSAIRVRTVRDLKKALLKKTSLRPKKRNVALRDEAPHAQRGGNISALVSCTASMAKNMMGRNMETALQT